MFRVAIAQFDGATTLRAPPLAAGLLAATLREITRTIGELAPAHGAPRWSRQPRGQIACVA